MPSRISQFWQELKRRNVVRVVTVYAGAAFVIIELVDILAQNLGLPSWIFNVVLILLLAGFLITVVVSWIYDIYPKEGIVKTDSANKVQEEDILKTSNSWKIASYISFLVIIVMGCILLYPKIFTKDKFSDLRDEEGVVSLAVLPFDNLTGDSSLHYWQNGISEYLINKLGNSEELRVSSTQVISDALESTQRQVNATSLSPDIARRSASKVSASTYIMGNYIGKESDMSIMLNLVNTESGELIWSTSVDGDLGINYRAVLNKLSDSVRNFMEIRALERNSETDFSNAYPNSAEAYRHYIEGLNALVASNYEIAIESLLKAYELDTTFTFAAFYLAFANDFSESRNMKEVYRWTIRAYELRESLPSFYNFWIESWYACYIKKDDVDFRRYCDLMYETTMHNRLLLFDLATSYTGLGDYAKSIEAFEKIEALNELWQDDWRYDRYYQFYARALLLADRPDDAERVITKGLGVNPDDDPLKLLRGAIHIRNGDSDGVKASEEWLKERVSAWGGGLGTYEHVIGSMYTLAKDSLTASGYFRKAWEMNPERINSLALLIKCQLESNVNLEECLRLADIPLEKQPQVAYYWLIKGISLFKLGRYEESLEYFKEASNKSFALNMEVVQYISLAEQALALQAQSQE